MVQTQENKIKTLDTNMNNLYLYYLNTSANYNDIIPDVNIMHV